MKSQIILSILCFLMTEILTHVDNIHCLGKNVSHKIFFGLPLAVFTGCIDCGILYVMMLMQCPDLN